MLANKCYFISSAWNCQALFFFRLSEIITLPGYNTQNITQEYPGTDAEQRHSGSLKYQVTFQDIALEAQFLLRIQIERRAYLTEQDLSLAPIYLLCKAQTSSEFICRAQASLCKKPASPYWFRAGASPILMCVSGFWIDTELEFIIEAPGKKYLLMPVLPSEKTIAAEWAGKAQSLITGSSMKK